MAAAMIQDWLAWTLGGILGRVAGSMATAAGAEALIPHRLHALNTRDIHQKAWIKNAGVCGGGGLCGDAKLVRGLQRSNIVDECTKDHDFAKACDPKDAKPAQTRLPLRHWTTHASWSAWPQESVLHSSGAMGSLQLASLVQELQRECVGGALAVRRVSTPPLSMMDLATLVGGGCLASNLASIWAHWDCTITFHQASSKEGAPPCPPLVRPTTPTLTIFAALLGVGLTIATNAKQAFPCTTRHPRSRPKTRAEDIHPRTAIGRSTLGSPGRKTKREVDAGGLFGAVADAQRNSANSANGLMREAPSCPQRLSQPLLDLSHSPPTCG